MTTSNPRPHLAPRSGMAAGQPQPFHLAHEPPITLPTVKARQGVTGHNVRYVLAYGLTGAVAVLAVVYLIYSA